VKKGIKIMCAMMMVVALTGCKKTEEKTYYDNTSTNLKESSFYSINISVSETESSEESQISNQQNVTISKTATDTYTVSMREETIDYANMDSSVYDPEEIEKNTTTYQIKDGKAYDSDDNEVDISFDYKNIDKYLDLIKKTTDLEEVVRTDNNFVVYSFNMSKADANIFSDFDVEIDGDVTGLMYVENDEEVTSISINYDNISISISYTY
jgi:hypothetical protein